MYVLDTNVVVAGLRSRNGASFRLLNLAIEGRLPIAVSVALALEYEAVLFREAHREVSWATAAEVELDPRRPIGVRRPRGANQQAVAPGFARRS